MWQSNWKVQASALFLCQGKRSVGQGILEHEIRVPRCFWGKIWSLGNKKEFAAHESLMDSGKTIDFHLSHLMFPPSYGWKDLFNLRCVFWVTNLGFLFDGLGNPGVSSLAKRYGSGWASSWVGILHLYIIQFKSRLVKAWLEICQSPQLTTENALEKLTLMSMTQSVFFDMWTFQWCQQRVKDVHAEVMYQQFEVYTWCWDIFRWYRWFLPEKTTCTSSNGHISHMTLWCFQKIGNFHGEMSLNLPYNLHLHLARVNWY